MNISGKWIGKYWMGEGYPPNLQGTSELFEIHFEHKENIISGICIDPCVLAIDGNSSSIIGLFDGKNIKFGKTYLIQPAIGENGSIVPFDEINSNVLPIAYRGVLIKKWFSKKMKFKGEWKLTVEHTESDGQIEYFVFSGLWEMTKA